jgi:hypothetical protein
MKYLLIIGLLALCSFQTQNTKKITLSFTIEEVQLIYDALGELPAKKVESLRAKIWMDAKKQIADTTK